MSYDKDERIISFLLRFFCLCFFYLSLLLWVSARYDGTYDNIYYCRCENVCSTQQQMWSFSFFFEEILEQAIVFAYFQIALFTRLLIVSDFPIFRMHAMCSLQPKFMIFACASRFLRAKTIPLKKKTELLFLEKGCSHLFVSCLH